MGELDKNLKRNLLFNTTGNLIYFFCQWLVSGLLVKTLSPPGEGVLNAGILATAMAASNMFLTLASYGMRNFQVSDTGEYSAKTYISSRYITIGAAVLLCATYSFVAGYRGEQFAAVILWLIYKLVESLSDVYHGCCQKQGRMDVIGVSYGVRGIVTVVSFAGVMVLTGRLLTALAVIAVLSCAFSIWYDVRRNRSYYLSSPSEPLSKVGALLLECLPLAIYSFLSTASASVPRLVLERVCGTETIGAFNLVNSPVMILQVGIAFLFSPFVGVFTDKLSSGDKAGFLHTAVVISLAVFGLGVVGEAGVLIFGGWGLELLYGAEIAIYKDLLVPMVAGTVFTCISIFYCTLLTVLRDMRGLIVSNVVGIAASIATSVLLVSRFGMFGATYAAIVALFVQCLCLASFGLSALNKRTQRLSDPENHDPPDPEMSES